MAVSTLNMPPYFTGYPFQGKNTKLCCLFMEIFDIYVWFLNNYFYAEFSQGILKVYNKRWEFFLKKNASED